MRIDGKDAFINCLGRWSDPVAVANAHPIAAQIWSDYQQGVFDSSLMAYQPLLGGKQVALLKALRVRAGLLQFTLTSCWSDTGRLSATAVRQRSFCVG
jgi:hypothetical protein